MAAARAGFGGGPVAAVFPLLVEEIDANASRAIPPCAVAELKAPVEALELKMRRDGRNEVFQQWELPEDESEEEKDEEEESLSLLMKLQRGVPGGRIKGFNQELPNPVVFPITYSGLPTFDLEEECQFPPRHSKNSAVPELEWSANILSIKVVDSTLGYPIDLYGSVFVRDDLDRERVYLFRRDRSDSQLVKSAVIYQHRTIDIS
ncbi:hypothetical protein PR202_gb01744 [Eleusine coracana subsp. coracana]|uniref:DUF6598 domain-containing protein n=1 Tax=Eleusine coracana subsp. coracana TaxID=191504 RepID=A0AAV5DXA9_ELECO|nr:hypothetical protein PR202_gb01744 [Eleusine coracana subsp. coracana]